MQVTTAHSEAECSSAAATVGNGTYQWTATSSSTATTSSTTTTTFARPECVWEWGGVSEADPKPCAEAVGTDMEDLRMSVVVGGGLGLLALFARLVAGWVGRG